MSTTVAPLGLRLFLEGVEVPVISAQVTISPDQPALAAIQIVPTDMSLAFLPRTLVHLFYLDNTSFRGGGRRQFPANQNRVNAPNDDYHVLFCGEVLGYTFSKTTDQRQIVLQCMDLSTYWDTCYEFFSDYSINGTGMFDRSATFSGAHVGLFDNVARGTSSVLASMIQTPPNTPEYSQCSGLLGGLIHLLEVVGGVSPNAVSPGYNGVNDFFTVADLRYNLLGMLGAVAADDSSARIFNQHAFYEWLMNGMTSFGNMMSFRDMLMYVNRFIFHNIYPNPCAYYAEGGQTITASVPLTQLANTAAGQGVLANLKTMLSVAGEALNTYTEAATGSEVSQVVNPASESSSTAPGALITEMDQEAFLSAADEQIKSIEFLDDSTDDLLDSISTSDVSNYKTKEAKIQADLDALDADMQLSPTQHAQQAKTHCQNLVSDLQAMLGLKQQSAGSTRKVVSTTSGNHLYNQLILPETFFVSPPRCNVIFPDQYGSFQYSRNFAREITRLMCQMGSGLIGVQDQNNLLGSWVVSPNIEDVNNATLSASLGESTRTILPHEVHGGVIPKMEWVNDGMRWNIKAGHTKDMQNNFIQRLADMQFYLHRWSSRSMSLQGIFLPHLVLGLPAVVLDRSAPSAAVLFQLQLALQKNWVLPTQYVGKIVNINHQISQQGGSSSVAFAYARAHRGIDDEFLTMANASTPQPVVTSTDTINLAHVANTDALSASDFTSWTWFQLLIRTYVGTSPSTLAEGTVINNRLITSVTTSGSLSVNADQAKNLTISDDVFNTLAGGGKTISVPATLVVEWEPIESPVSFSGSAQAFEDLVMPGWMQANIWNNKNITQKVYDPLLGSSAITDDLSLGTAALQQLMGQQEQQAVAAIQAMAESAVSGMTDTPGIVGTPAQVFPGGPPYVVVSGSVEECIDGLAVVYGMMREKNADIHSFIKQFNARPIATITDILGSSDLDFDPAGNVLNTKTMIEGFHSRAFGDYNTDVKFAARAGDTDQPGKDALKLLLPPGGKMRTTVGDKSGIAAAINPMVDPRGRARARVLAYLAELQVSRGLMG
jgi:hypothetical protein